MTLAFSLAAAVAIDAAARQLAKDVRLAMQRADMTLDYTARVIGVPTNKLSDQLNGKTWFTAFPRFGLEEIRRDTDFWLEFNDILAQRLNRSVVRADLGVLIAKVDEWVGTRQQLKMALPSRLREKESA